MGSSKVTGTLRQNLLSKADDDLVDVVIELTPPASPGPQNESRAERTVALKQQFSRVAEPVEQRILSAGGKVLEHAWINQTLKARVPAGKVDQIVDADDVASIDVAHHLSRE
jgi:hypothetical protein